MMIVKDLRDEFYSEIKGKRVLIVVNYDIDAICACKILQTLFKADYTLYTLVAVDATSDLKLSIQENQLDEKYVIFINCGGTIDLVEELTPAEGITYFVLDSHRPLDVCNIYNGSQVRLLSLPDGPVPDFEDIFSSDDDNDDEQSRDGVESDEDEDSEEYENRRAKRRRLTEKAVLRRRDRRRWESKRDSLLFNYSKYSYYGRSSALVMFDLAWKMSKDNFDLLWYAIIGLSEQLLMRKIGESSYVNECGDVQGHIARLTHRSSQLGDEGRNTGIRIDFEKEGKGMVQGCSPQKRMEEVCRRICYSDYFIKRWWKDVHDGDELIYYSLRLALMRHWTVKSSLTYSVFTATRLRLWTFKGEKRLHEMLAEIGIPLIQCNQKFASMDLVFRREFQESLEKMTEKYSLDGITFISFLMQHGFRAKYSAMDFVHGLMALLQSHNDERPKADCFLECLEALCRTKKEKIDQGIDLAKKILTSVFKQVQNALEMKQIQCAGPFLYFIVQEGNADPMLCNHPYGIFLLAEFALRAYISVTKTNKYKIMPLVISTPCIKDKTYAVPGEPAEASLCHITGIAPVPQENNTNFFGRAFKKASETSFAPIVDVYFDWSVIKMNVKDRARFIDALAILLNED